MNEQTEFSFEKEGVVSLWFSTAPYDEIPDSYFDADESGLNTWEHNFKIQAYEPETMETNGAMTGTVTVEKAVGECSYSRSFVDKVVHKINKLGVEQITWVILLYDFEYRPKKTKVYKDDYVQFLAAYPYEMEAESLYEPEQ